MVTASVMPMTIHSIIAAVWAATSLLTASPATVNTSHKITQITTNVSRNATKSLRVIVIGRMTTTTTTTRMMPYLALALVVLFCSAVAWITFAADFYGAGPSLCGFIFYTAAGFVISFLLTLCIMILYRHTYTAAAAAAGTVEEKANIIINKV